MIPKGRLKGIQYHEVRIYLIRGGLCCWNRNYKYQLSGRKSLIFFLKMMMFYFCWNKLLPLVTIFLLICPHLLKDWNSILLNFDDKSKTINEILTKNGFNYSIIDDICVYVVDWYHHKSLNRWIDIEYLFRKQTCVCMQVNTHLKQYFVGFWR